VSGRNTLSAKRGRKAAKALRNTPTGYTDLVRWIQQREHVSTGRAIKMILAGCLMVDSHAVGVKQTKRGAKFIRCIPAYQGRQIRVVVPEALR
jgi:hypothetical protein